MSRRLNRVWLLLACLLTGEVWALGLGDIQLHSALNEPLRAEIQLISATPEELDHLAITIASSETFERYGIDRPLFLRSVAFKVIPSGRTDGNIIRVTSSDPVTEPFLTFLVDANWSRGRLLREYTLLVDPPTFAPPATQAPQAVTAPTRSTPADSGRITRSPPPVAAAPVAPVPTPRSQPSVEPAAEPTPQPSPVAPPPAVADVSRPATAPAFNDSPGGDFAVQRGDTLWGIANRIRDDNRLTINQTMLAIYEANPQAFEGNINRLSAGATLRIPSADEIFSISRGAALSEVQRQHDAWGGVTGVGVSQPEPSLTLVSPDEDTLTSDTSSLYDADDLALVDDDVQAAADARILEVTGLLEDHQDGLIVIGDNELAALRAELVEMTGEALPEELAVEIEVAEPADDEIFVESADDSAADALPDDDAEALPADEDVDSETTATTDTAPKVVPVQPRDEPSLIDTIKEAIFSIWGLIGAALIVVAGVLVWFARRAASSDDDDSTGMWQALDADEEVGEPEAATESLRALARDDVSTMVVEEEPMPEPDLVEPATMEMPVAETEVPAIGEALVDPLGDTGTNRSLEDTFSSDTAINLDQSDPIAEADFHMAYGLYDQAADLINGALAVEPERQDLLTKLCEIYFVWGNRDAFVDAATRLNDAGTDHEDSEWDKIVIMGQQIAADHDMFADAKPGAATKAVDLSFDSEQEEAGALDMDFAIESENEDEIIDLGAAADSSDDGDASAIDFAFDEEPDLDVSVTQEMPAAEASATLEMPSADSLDDVFEEATVAADVEDSVLETPTVETPVAESTVESPTIEQQLEATGQMPALAIDEATEIAGLDELPASDETAEIDLDDLGLDLDSLAESDVADVAGADDDFLSDLDDTAESQTLKIDDSLVATGRNPMLSEEDLEATGQNTALPDDVGSTGLHDMSDIERELAATSELPTIEDVTGKNPALSAIDGGDTDVGIDTSLLDATGQTQVLPEDFVVETGTGTNIEKALADDEVTMLASLDDDDEPAVIADDAATLMASLDDDGDFDYAKTEALPRDAFTGDLVTDDTGVMKSIAGSTDMDLDLDDLTAALKVSAAGDTIDQMRDDATVEQPRPGVTPASVDESPTAAIAPEDLSGDLHDARTMTEVGTKLDLARAYVDMGDPSGARSILEEVLDEGDEGQRQQAQQLLDSLPS